MLCLLLTSRGSCYYFYLRLIDYLNHESAYRVIKLRYGCHARAFGTTVRRLWPSSTMPNTIRASVVQTCTASFNLSDTLEKFESLTKLAKERDGTQLAVFPEAL